MQEEAEVDRQVGWAWLWACPWREDSTHGLFPRSSRPRRMARASHLCTLSHHDNAAVTAASQAKWAAAGMLRTHQEEARSRTHCQSLDCCPSIVASFAQICDPDAAPPLLFFAFLRFIHLGKGCNSRVLVSCRALTLLSCLVSVKPGS